MDSPAVIHSILDLWPNKHQIGVRRASSNSPLVSMLGKEHGGSAKGTKVCIVVLLLKENQKT